MGNLASWGPGSPSTRVDQVGSGKSGNDQFWESEVDLSSFELKPLYRELPGKLKPDLAVASDVEN
jgi:hypothetical protein